MRLDAQAAQAFHCPRWGELPDIPLYMDQVVIVLEGAAGIFSDGERAVTPTMVNNYVKHGVIPPPEKKKYKKNHLAQLVVVSIMKRVLSMNEIIILKQAIIGEEGGSNSYNLFCDKLEHALCTTFCEGATPPAPIHPQSGALGTLDAGLSALMGKLYVQNYMEEHADTPSEGKPAK